MLVDDLSFELVWCECARFFDFCSQFSHPPDTRAKGWVSGVGWPPNFAEKVGYRVSGVPRVQGPALKGNTETKW
jgi:hypothetical protein